jgi:hypothetical protein
MDGDDVNIFLVEQTNQREGTEIDLIFQSSVCLVKEETARA